MRRRRMMLRHHENEGSGASGFQSDFLHVVYNGLEEMKAQ